MGIVRKRQNSHKQTPRTGTQSRIPEGIMAISAGLVTFITLVGLLLEIGANVPVWIFSMTAFIGIFIGLTVLMKRKGWV